MFLHPYSLTLSLCQEGTEPLLCEPGRFQATIGAELLHEASDFAKSSQGCSPVLEFSDPNTHEAIHPPLGCILHHVENPIRLSMCPPLALYCMYWESANADLILSVSSSLTEDWRYCMHSGHMDLGGQLSNKIYRVTQGGSKREE